MTIMEPAARPADGRDPEPCPRYALPIGSLPTVERGAGSRHGAAERDDTPTDAHVRQDLEGGAEEGTSVTANETHAVEDLRQASSMPGDERLRSHRGTGGDEPLTDRQREGEQEEGDYEHHRERDDPVPRSSQHERAP